MTNLTKKIVAIATGLTFAAMLFPVVPVQALTAEELQDQIDALMETLADLQDQLEELTGEPAEVECSCTFTRSLYPGVSRGDDVKCLQEYLNDSGYTLAESGAGSPGNETTYFGSLTRAAVKAWQDANGVEYGDWWGYFGPISQAKYDEVCVAGEQEEEEEEEEEEPGDGLTVALADDNPAAATIVSDSGTGHSAQSMIPFLKVKFTNGDASEVKITQIDLTRSGISADGDISQAYLYEGDTVLAEYNSFSSAVLSFSNSAGLVTIPAGESKTVTLKCDLTNETTSGKTIRFSIVSSDDVVSDASSINGTFGLVGNYMSTAVTTDVGQLTVTTSTAAGTTVDPQDGLEIYNLTLAGADQKLEVRKVKFTNIGSTGVGDLKNFMLYDGGVQIGSTIEDLNSDKTVTFDLTDSPLVIDKGITKNLHLKADIVSGTNRTFQFSIQEIVDIVVYDTGYGIYVKPNKADSWTVFQMAASTINTGKLTLSRASDSPSGNVAKSATNVTIAKFDVKATGEDVKITAMSIKTGGTNIGTDGLYQGKIYFDGSQKDTTTNLNSHATIDSCTAVPFTFGNTFIVPADGNTYTLEVKADIKTKLAAAFDGNEQFAVKISSVTATGRSSLQTVSVGTAVGFTLSITTGDLSYAKNEAQPNWTAGASTGVAGATEVLVGSFVVTAGASEGADITSLKVKFTTTTNTILQNLKLYNGDTQIGSTLGTFNADTSYTFYPSPYVSLAAGAQFVLSVYADILTGATAGANGHITLQEAAGVGQTTANSITYTSNVNGQTIYIAGAGSVALSQDASTPISDIMVMGSSAETFAIFKYSASTSAENIKITSIVATTTLSNCANSSVNGIKLIADGFEATLASLDSSGVATFNLASNPLVITAGTEEKVTIKANVAPYPYASSTGTVQFGIATTTYQGAVSGTVTSTAAAANWEEANAMTVYRTRPTVSFVGPSAGILADGTKTLIEFSVTADAGQDVNIYSFNFGVTISDTATTTGNLHIEDIVLYDKAAIATALVDKIATTTGTAYGPARSVANSDFGKNKTSASLTGNIEVFDTSTTTVMDVIPAGTTVTYVLKALVSGSAQYDSLSVRLADLSTSDKNALRWGDQWQAGIDSTYVKVVPTDYASLSR